MLPPVFAIPSTTAPNRPRARGGQNLAGEAGEQMAGVALDPVDAGTAMQNRALLIPGRDRLQTTKCVILKTF